MLKMAQLASGDGNPPASGPMLALLTTAPLPGLPPGPPPRSTIPPPPKQAFLGKACGEIRKSSPKFRRATEPEPTRSLWASWQAGRRRKRSALTLAGKHFLSVHGDRPSRQGCRVGRGGSLNGTRAMRCRMALRKPAL